MRKLLCMLLLMPVIAIAQQMPVSQTIGTASTENRTKGIYVANIGYVLTGYVDTASINLNPYLKNYPYAIVATNDNKVWMRNASALKWLQIDGDKVLLALTDTSIAIRAYINSRPTIFTGGKFLANSDMNMNGKTITYRDTTAGYIGRRTYGAGGYDYLFKDPSNASIYGGQSLSKTGFTVQMSGATSFAYYAAGPTSIISDIYNFITDDEVIVGHYGNSFSITAQNGADISKINTVTINKDSITFGNLAGTKFNVLYSNGRQRWNGYKNNFPADSLLTTDAAGNVKNVSKNDVFPGAGLNIANSNLSYNGSHRISGNGYHQTVDSLTWEFRDTAANNTGHLYSFNKGFTTTDYDTISVSSQSNTALGGIKFQVNDRNNLDSLNRLWLKNDGTIEITSTSEINITGKTNYPATIITAGTTGNATINKNTGVVNMAAAGTVLTVTNNLVATNSQVYITIRGSDPTAIFQSVTVAAGSFTINLSGAPSAEVPIEFWVINK